MTRKNHIAIAGAFRRLFLKHPRADGYRRGLEDALEVISDALAADNPLFDPEKFRRAATDNEEEK